MTALHLKQILQTYPDQPILLLWDRAPWHKGPSIRDVLNANPRLEIMPFPKAAPDLNPQEHVWKKTRRAVSHNHLIPRIPDLADKFEEHLTTNIFESSLLDRYGFNYICKMFK
jgi:transposase